MTRTAWRLRGGGRAAGCVLAACALAALAAACDTGSRRTGYDHVAHPRPARAAGAAAMRPARWITLGGESRRAWRLSPGEALALRASVPEQGRLELALAVEPSSTAAAAAPSCRVAVETADGASREVVRKSISGAGWQPAAADLARFAGRDVTLRIGCDAAGEATPPAGEILVGEVVLLGRASGVRLPNVILVTLDTTRADVAADPDVAPQLAALARRGIAFDDAWSAATSTSPGHASILTGLPVDRHGTASNRSRLAADQTTLAEHLQRRGYQTAASVSVGHLGPEVGFAQGFDRFRPAAQGDARDGARALAPVLDWLAAWRRDGARPFFLWLHLFDPHTPYGPPADFVQGELARRGFALPPAEADPPTVPVFPGAGAPPVPLDWLAGITSAEHVDALYRAGVAYADHLLGRLLAALDESGEGARSIIVVTADHGEALGEQDVWYQHAGLWPASLRVPLVLSVPGGPDGVRSDARVSTVDVLPTVLRALGGEPPALPGRDLLAVARRPDPSRRVWFAEAGLVQLGFRDAAVHFGLALRPGQYGMLIDRSDGWPRVRAVRRYRAGASWLFDVSADPDLRRNLAHDGGAGAERYAAEVRQRAEAGLARLRTRTLSADEEAALRALGYVDGGP